MNAANAAAGKPANDRRRMLFYVQHLLGIGHLKRAATLSRALEEAGFAVTMVSGGFEVPGIDAGGAAFVQLSPVRAADRHFTGLVGSDHREIDDGLRNSRRERLLATFARVKPHMVMTELFPFGRRQLRFEILPLLEAARAARPRPYIVSSVRDILVEPSRESRVMDMVENFERFYDLALIHGDPGLIPFDATFSPADRIKDRLRYTGYVVETPVGKGGAGAPGAGEVIVSAGGGALSEPLLEAALAARKLTRLNEATWRLLAGHALAEDAFRRLGKMAGDGVIVERARPDFTTLLANCALSISQGGYNTVMELLAAGARGVIAPYAGGKETEQTLRARLLQERSALQVVWEDDIGPETIARAADAALLGPPLSAAGIDTDGAAETARILGELVAHDAPITA
jgi:predicted glycosyltransferase